MAAPHRRPALPAEPAGQEAWIAETNGWYRALRSARKSPNTISFYTESIDQFAASQTARGRSLDPLQITRSDIQSFMGELAARGMSPGTQQARYRGLSALFSYLEDELDLERSPIHRKDRPRAPLPDVPILSPAQIERLLRACRGKGFMDRRDEAIIRLMLSTGGRRSEIAGLLRRDLDDRAGEVRFHGKGETIRTVRYGDETASAIQRYLRLRALRPEADRAAELGRSDTPRSGPPLWLGIDDRGPLTGSGISVMLKRRAALAGLPEIHLHQLRHTWTDLMLSGGQQPNDVARLGGWSSTQMLDRYGRAGADRRARRAYTDPMDRLAALIKDDDR